MKKIIALILALMLTLSLAACEKAEKKTDSNDNNSQIVSDVNSTPENNDDANTESDVIDTESDANTESDVTDTESDANGENEEFKDDDAEEETTNTGDSANNDKNDEDEKPEEEKIVLEFFNDTIEGRYNDGKLTVLPRHVYFQNGRLYAECFIVNTTGNDYSNLSVIQMNIFDKNGKKIAGANFNADQAITIKDNTYIPHTYIFSGDQIENTKVDMSTLTLNWKFN